MSCWPSDAIAGAVSNPHLAQGGTSNGDNSGINLQVGLTASTARSEQNTHDDVTYGSHIKSAGDITIAATGGDLNIIGSQLSGNNVALAAANNLNLLSQTEQHSDTQTSHNASGGVGVSLGSNGFNIYVQAAMGESNAHGNGETHTDSTVTAAGTLSLISGNDTTIKGAQATGNAVLASIGGNLNLASEQDTDDYASKQWQAGGTVMFGLGGGGSVSASLGKADNHYASVTQTSGIGAGDGGYQIVVGGNTDLKGAVIASTADASHNVLNTGTLSYSDIANQASYSATSVSVGGGSGGFGLPGIAVPQGKDASSTTQAAIANGTLVVRNNPSQDLSGLSHDASLDNTNALKNDFDPAKIAEQQQLGQLAGQVGMTAVGDLASYMASHATTDADKAAWSDGGEYKTILHGLVGAATAALGNGNAAQGALGAAASELSSTAMESYLLQQGIGPDSSLGKTLMQLGSAAVGGAVGGGSGASIALQGAQFNDQHHAANYLDKLKGCQQNPSASGCGTILQMQGDSSYVISSPDATNGFGLVANVDSQSHQIVSYTFTDGQGQPTMIMEPQDYNAFVNNPLSGLTIALGPEYASSLGNAYNDALTGQWAKAGTNLTAIFTSGEYWRDMLVASGGAAAALPSGLG